MIKQLLGMFSWRYPTVLVYMLQSTEYDLASYHAWLLRTKDFGQVMQRRTLDKTRAANVLLQALRIGIGLQIALSGLLIYLGLMHHLSGGLYFGVALFLVYPLVWPYLIIAPALFGKLMVSGPRARQLVSETEKIFANHPGIKIAIAGSYGKTSMKELLATVLSEGLKVAATPGNKNVSISHARFAISLAGDEDVVIIEYGEGAPGDIARFARHTHPTHAIITGLAPAHLNAYKTLEAAGKDIFAVADYLHDRRVYVNDESAATQAFIKSSHNRFNRAGALGWRFTKAVTNLAGSQFVLTKGKRKVELESGLVGLHQAGFLALAASLALELGLTPEQVKAGMRKTQPFEHRMQPYQLAGAWIIDDTYNGNLEGVRAGTELLKQLKAKRKIYVTPGLVEQGAETQNVHHEVGKLIAESQADIVVLMQNSATEHIQAGLQTARYKGEIRLETQPLDFYTNLSHYVAAGDLVLMQNDWTDNYA